jgi:ABC-type molybdenum transport system ATPase subunit/photorepair protein PhrA
VKCISLHALPLALSRSMFWRALARTQPRLTNTLRHTQWQRHNSTAPIISIQNGTFYKHHPSSLDAQSNPPLFPNVSYTLTNGTSTTSSTRQQHEYWSVISPSSVARTTFLQILAGQHICLPPTARRYPALSEAHTSLHHALKYVGFDAERGTGVSGTNVRGAYLSARYESRREETDFTVLDYLTGHTELNALEREATVGERDTLQEVTEQLDLGKLLDMPVANLSNGQTRRARIAKAVMERPDVLLLDGPFMGLDPRTRKRLDGVLRRLTESSQPRLVVSLRPEDEVPEWISHVVVVDENLKVIGQGHKEKVLNESKDFLKQSIFPSGTDATQLSRDGFPKHSPPLPKGEALVELNGVRVSYGPKTVLGDWQQPDKPTPGLWWSLHRGQRCGIFGPNGSGKTTMLSLITSDHPQTYGLPIKLFGRSRLPSPGQPGISVFDLQRKMGHSSPEVHAFFPKTLSLRRTLESAWADAPLAKPTLDDVARQRVDATLRWFAGDLRQQRRGPHTQTDKTVDEGDLTWATSLRFAELSFSAQRLALFLRAIVHRPPLIILDEAFSGIDESVRDRALAFLSRGEQGKGTGVMEGLGDEQALLVISHAKEDVPGCVREWICLPEPGEQRIPRMGELEGPLELNVEGWGEIWGV